jgi:hypothetical protein
MILGSLLASCGLFDSGVEWRGGPYELAWIDIPDDVYVARVLGNGNSLGRIDARVFAVGWDGRYLVAQQHPQGDKRITNYYIIDSFRDNESADASKVLIGPLSETEFKKKSALLRLPGFTKILPSLK